MRRGELRVTPTSFLSLFHPEDRTKIVRLVGEPSASGGAFELELRLLLRNGEARRFQARGRTVRDAAGHQVRMGGSVTDIEYRKQTEAQLYAEKERGGDACVDRRCGDHRRSRRVTSSIMNAVAERLTEWPSTRRRDSALASECSP